jgi:non-ribosomal peptide synthetase component F
MRSTQKRTPIPIRCFTVGQTFHPLRHDWPKNTFRHAYNDSRLERARRDLRSQLIADHAEKLLRDEYEIGMKDI